MTIESEVAALTTATNDLLAAVNVRKTALDTAVDDAETQAVLAMAQAELATTNGAAQVALATTQANNAAASAAAAASSQTASGTFADTATSKAAEATASAAAAASAVLGQTTSKLVLDVVDQTVFASTTLVDAVIYDTSKDSDGGKWRKRCQHTSWYNETIYGKWLGSAASEAAARAISGATTNDYYFDTAANKFYALNASSGRTEVFRGNVREFPARVLITAEVGRVVIWDLTVPNPSMWMAMTAGFTSVSGVAAKCGVVAIGQGGLDSTGRALWELAFPMDVSTHRVSVAPSSNHGRNLGINRTLPVQQQMATGTIAHNIVSDVALTVLPDAPIDPVTGLAVPTIAVATDGGISVIKHDGTVVNITGQAAAVDRVSFNKSNEIVTSYNYSSENAIFDIPSSSGTFSTAKRKYNPITSSGNYPNTLTTGGAQKSVPMRRASVAISSSAGLSHLRENPASPTLGMVAYSTIAYASGWMPGDIRGAYITSADGVTETLTGVELVTNGTFDVDTSGWGSSDSGTKTTVSWDASGKLRADKIATGWGGVTASSTAFVPGKTYVIAADVDTTNMTGGGVAIGVSGIPYSSPFTGVGKISLNFTATGNHIPIVQIQSNATSGYILVDNISVREVIADRSVKNNGLVINGSLSKAPVASGAGLCAISGFSATNYLEQPYSANLDFGTGDFCAMGWVAMLASPTNVYESVFSRVKPDATGPSLGVHARSDGRIGVYTSNGGSVITEGGDSRGKRVFVAALRRSGVMYLYIDAALIASGANTQDISSPDARLVLGNQATTPSAGNRFSGSLTLWRISATAPSESQIKTIYETERKLFEPGAQCGLAGTSNAVTALAYDDATDLLHVGTSWGRSAFQGLLRVSSEATPVGAIKALAASGGAVVQAGASAVDVYLPAYSLREELARKEEAAKALGSTPVFHEFDATTGQTAFVVPAGFRVIAVYSAGALKRVGSTKDYLVADNGYQQTVNFAVAPGAGTWVSVMTVRSN